MVISDRFTPQGLETICCQKLESNEIVHHKNDDPKDNRIENLQLMTKSEHIKYHYSKGDL